MHQPHLPHQLIIPPLIQEQLMMPPERRIRLTMLIQIRSVRITPIARSMGKENHALADIDEEADFAAAFAHVLVAAAFVLVFHAANGLGAEDFTAEQADGWVGDFFASRWAFVFDGFFGQGVVVFRQSDEFEDGWVWKLDWHDAGGLVFSNHAGL